MSGRVTIKSIAKDLGISHMTVSRALSDNPNVLKATREAVQKRAQELGYVKSAAAMAMRGDGTQIVGLLLPNIVNEFYARFANTMAQSCVAQGLQLIIHLTNDDYNVERLALERLLEVQAAAVVMVPTPAQESFDDQSIANTRIIQLIRQRASATPTSAVIVEDSAAIEQAVAHLVRLGHKKIAYIGADQALSSGRSRLAAFQNGLANLGIEANANLIRSAPPSFEMGRKSATDLFALGGATALVCGGFEVSNGALSAYMDRLSDSGERIAFVGYGDPAFYAWVDGGITTVQIPVEELARRAVDMVTRKTDDAQTFTLRANLVVRS
ncbi:LacI family DNA-binding transcriptional regulator [Falsihalocynthiibacter sp. SS001]|uniref:LacI family DNA-binding transcriptional regulator n=1 Tax=Falsihalocynthiibacter sp. SS001 TaxID=3349698 RepID=UPI0036D400B2